MQRYDAIILGMGGVGSAALYHAVRRGARVLGIDQFQSPHDRGSSHGQTRVIRLAYFEHAEYVPLLLESYRLWRDLEQESNRRLLEQVGLIQVGPPDGIVIPGVLRAAKMHQLPLDRLSSTQVENRWPGLRVPPELEGAHEPSAGYLLVEDCVEAHLQAARLRGASLLPNVRVQQWTSDNNGISVKTTAGNFLADRLIIAAGPWARQMLRELNVPLTVRRKSLFWFDTGSKRYEKSHGFPVFLFELPSGVFYGFPKIDARGVKFAEHSGGRTIDDPLVVDREVDSVEQQRLRGLLPLVLPGVTDKVTDHAVCFYTMSPDEHFIIDRHPACSCVVFAAGLSGHGFKFTPALGRVLVELAFDGGTALPVDFLSLKRFAR